MSRVGRQPITIPSGVSVSFDGQQVMVSGSKGNLTQPMLEGLSIDLNEDKTIATISNKDVNNASYRSNHGLMRTLVNNMVMGVSNGFSKKLEINGVGYRVSLSGSNALKLSLGYSHDITFTLPEGVSANVEQNIITISGADKQRVGQVASEIRELRKPEPYKGKGIKYDNEYIIRKSGKSGKESK